MASAAGRASILNIIGLNIGKWLQNAGGVGTYVPLLMLVGVAALVVFRHGSATHFTWHNMMPAWNWDTVNFWSQIAFAFTGLELVSRHERRGPRSLPHPAARGLRCRRSHRAHVHRGHLRHSGSGARRPTSIRKSGVFHAITVGSIALRVGFLGMLAAILVTAGNAGGVGSTVAGIARVPFVVGIDRYLPAGFGKIHPALEDALYLHPRPGRPFRRSSAPQPDQ